MSTDTGAIRRARPGCFAGPMCCADTAGNLLEVGVIDSADGPIIVHAMPARPNYLR